MPASPFQGVEHRGIGHAQSHAAGSSSATARVELENAIPQR